MTYNKWEHESKKTLVEANKHLLELETDPEKRAKLQRLIEWDSFDVERFDKLKPEYDAAVLRHKARVGTVVPLGSFELTGNKLRITDPCYSKDTWCAGVLDNVKPGKWFAYAQYVDEGSWGIRNSTLFALHESSLDLQKFVNRGFLYENHMSNQANIDVGVDSGQAGMFDENLYPTEKKDMGEYGELDTFYGRACATTSGGDLSPPDHLGAGVVPEGCVSSSGDGDGSYRCFYETNAEGQIDAVEITFYHHDNELEDEEDLEEEDARE